ncbi:hypothetical protein Bbelb_075000 [Branchiostoma belcheri]|nr:hypothetical protein Bbelb_075000 [Branchiostoma belcheri]
MSGVPEIDPETFLNFLFRVFIALFVVSWFFVLRACIGPIDYYTYKKNATPEDSVENSSSKEDLVIVEDGNLSFFLSDPAQKRRTSLLLTRRNDKKKLRRRASNLV